jgi:hypothetical protein
VVGNMGNGNTPVIKGVCDAHNILVDMVKDIKRDNERNYKRYERKQDELAKKIEFILEYINKQESATEAMNKSEKKQEDREDKSSEIFYKRMTLIIAFILALITLYNFIQGQMP